jgi:hypothetical protein
MVFMWKEVINALIWWGKLIAKGLRGLAALFRRKSS